MLGDGGTRDGSSEVAAAMVAANADVRSGLQAGVHLKSRVMLPGSEGSRFYQLEFVLLGGFGLKNKTLI